MIEVIPAIDLIDGKCVRLMQGDLSRKTVYSDDPVETAKRFAAAGLKRLHIVDLDGAMSGTPANIRVLEKVANAVDAVIDYGGGIKTEANVKEVFDAGAKAVNIGSIAVAEPELFFSWVDHFGGDSILLGADVRDRMLTVNGWKNVIEIDVVTFLRDYRARGARRAFVTDAVRDGTLDGPATQLYTEIRASVPDLSLIASGGVSSVADIETLDRIGCDGVIIGKAIYEERIRLEELTSYAG